MVKKAGMGLFSRKTRQRKPKVATPPIHRTFSCTRSVAIKPGVLTFDHDDGGADHLVDRGASGDILLARYYGAVVVAKRFQPSSSPSGSGALAGSSSMMNADLNASSTLSIGNDEEFEKEVRIHSGLVHPNIVQFIGAVIHRRLLVMEYITGGNLSDLIRHRPDVFRLGSEGAARRLAGMLQGLASAMCYLHAQDPPILHRDLKSTNVLLTSGYQVKLCDFGTSRTLDVMNPRMSLRVGTQRWTAPEVFGLASRLRHHVSPPVVDATANSPSSLSGERPHDAVYTTKADVFSFAVVVWEMLALRMPWHNLTFNYMIEDRVLMGERPPTQSHWPIGLTHVMRRCWAHAPYDRPDFPEILEFTTRLCEKPEHYLAVAPITHKRKAKKQPSASCDTSPSPSAKEDAAPPPSSSSSSSLRCPNGSMCSNTDPQHFISATHDSTPRTIDSSSSSSSAIIAAGKPAASKKTSRASRKSRSLSRSLSWDGSSFIIERVSLMAADKDPKDGKNPIIGAKGGDVDDDDDDDDDDADADDDGANDDDDPPTTSTVDNGVTQMDGSGDDDDDDDINDGDDDDDDGDALSNNSASSSSSLPTTTTGDTPSSSPPSSSSSMVVVVDHPPQPASSSPPGEDIPSPLCEDLLIAAQRGHADAVADLLSLRANPNASNSDGYTPLMLACAGSHLEVARELLQTSPTHDHCDASRTSGGSGTSCLHLHARASAAQGGHTHNAHWAQLIPSMLTCSADPNGLDRDGATALMVACKSASPDICRTLLACGADPNARDAQGQSPLRIVLLHRLTPEREQLAQMLFQYGAKVRPSKGKKNSNKNNTNDRKKKKQQQRPQGKEVEEVEEEDAVEEDEEEDQGDTGVMSLLHANAGLASLVARLQGDHTGAHAPSSSCSSTSASHSPSSTASPPSTTSPPPPSAFSSASSSSSTSIKRSKHKSSSKGRNLPKLKSAEMETSNDPHPSSSTPNSSSTSTSHAIFHHSATMRRSGASSSKKNHSKGRGPRGGHRPSRDKGAQKRKKNRKSSTSSSSDAGTPSNHAPDRQKEDNVAYKASSSIAKASVAFGVTSDKSSRSGRKIRSERYARPKRKEKEKKKAKKMKEREKMNVENEDIEKEREIAMPSPYDLERYREKAIALYELEKKLEKEEMIDKERLLSGGDWSIVE